MYVCVILQVEKRDDDSSLMQLKEEVLACGLIDSLLFYVCLLSCSSAPTNV